MASQGTFFQQQRQKIGLDPRCALSHQGGERNVSDGALQHLCTLFPEMRRHIHRPICNA